jgi:hypothetical protein
MDVKNISLILLIIILNFVGFFEYVKIKFKKLFYLLGRSELCIISEAIFFKLKNNNHSLDIQIKSWRYCIVLSSQWKHILAIVNMLLG